MKKLFLLLTLSLTACSLLPSGTVTCPGHTYKAKNIARDYTTYIFTDEDTGLRNSVPVSQCFVVYAEYK